MVTPPTENLNQAVLAAAKIAGVDRVIGVGGVQAVAALMYGAGFIPRVDKLVGPGSAYVAAAKRMAYGTVDIDMVAGPSEILIVADDTANPKFVAADLMSQAEHDKLASPCCSPPARRWRRQSIKRSSARCPTWNAARSWSSPLPTSAPPSSATPWSAARSWPI